MKYYIILSLTLFSFLTNTLYPAQKVDCNENQIRVFYEGNWFSINLFNVFVHEDVNVCTYLEGDITFEFEELLDIKEPYSAYLFVDGKLLQNVLVDEGKASVLNNSLAYKYQIKEESKAVMSENVERKEDTIVKQRFYAYGIIALYSAFCIAILGKYRSIQKDINKIKNDV